jgi:hypothetical protein
VHSVTETALRIIVEFLKREGVDAEFTESGARLGIGETTVHPPFLALRDILKNELAEEVGKPVGRESKSVSRRDYRDSGVPPGIRYAFERGLPHRHYDSFGLSIILKGPTPKSRHFQAFHSRASCRILSA